jgi:3-oxoacyl-[acyl-carrier-protein] synthase II
MNPRVVVTAAGVISPLGAGVENFGCALFAGKSAVAPSPRFPGLSAADLGDFNPQPWLGNKGIRVLDRSARLLAVAAQMALCDSGLSLDNGEREDPGLGLVCGTAFGSLHSITSFDWSGLQDGPNYVSPMEFPNTVINAPAGQAAIKHKLRGANSTVCAGLASGLYAIHYAAEFLRFGRADALLAGGVEELCEESVEGFRKTGVTSPSGRAQPFGADRDGIVPGEGSALWMLETADTAEARGRPPWLEICGFGSAQDAHSICAFDLRGHGAVESMQQALANSEINADQVACVIASASGSIPGDEMEARALERVFGAALSHTPVCAPKAAFGEAMGASGALSALAAGIALLQRSVPPTAGFTGDGSRLQLCAQAQPISKDYALVNAFGCDGNNASLVIRLWKN